MNLNPFAGNRQGTKVQEHVLLNVYPIRDMSGLYANKLQISYKLVLCICQRQMSKNVGQAKIQAKNS